MLYYKGNSNRSLLFTSFVQLILDLNGIVSKEEDMLEAPKILEESEVSMMICYMDTNDVYYYLEKLGRNIFYGQIMEPKKDSIVESGSFDVGVLSVDARAYFDELFGNIMEDNQVHEEQIMSCIEVMAKEVDEVEKS